MQALTDIRKVLGRRIVLDSLNLKLKAGGINCLLGCSGCGKSTLLRVAAGLLPADSGQVHIAAQDCAVVFQEPRLLPWLTVKENLALALPGSLTHKEQTNLIEEALCQVRLIDVAALLPRELSGGMAQRVGIARALLRHPQVLLMDEPFAALDAITRGHLQEMLVQLIAEKKITCVFVTHDINEALHVGEEISLMHRGRIAQTLAAATPQLKQHIVDSLQQHQYH